jgi:hypothetical protein
MMTEPTGNCPEREGLLQQWTDCSARVARLLSGQLAAMKGTASRSAGLDDQIRLARAEEVEACRSYYAHLNAHECV